jgi:hypothetical protein
MILKQGKNQKGGMIMKTRRTIKVVVVVIGALAMLCSHLTLSTALAQGSSDFSSFSAAMAMATLAEKEIRINEQKRMKDNEVKIVQNNSTVTKDTKGYQKNYAEKDIYK